MEPDETRDAFRFPSLADATARVYATAEPLLLTRFEPVATERMIIAANAPAAADHAPVPGERPDVRRDRDVTADIELDYLYHQLVERGHARQVISIGGRLRELTVIRVFIEGDDAVYGFVWPRSR